MAQLYVGEQFWTDQARLVTATSKKGHYRSRSEFVQTVNDWMDQHAISYKWAGEHTHEQDGVITYGYTVKITAGPEEYITFFNLKWA